MDALWIGGPYNTISGLIGVHANDAFPVHESKRGRASYTVIIVVVVVIGGGGYFPQLFRVFDHHVLFLESLCPNENEPKGESESDMNE